MTATTTTTTPNPDPSGSPGLSKPVGDPPLLEVRNLTVTYGGGADAVPAVRGVDLRVEAGQKLGIAGESGCGKSTLALALLRLLPATATLSGEILLDGEDVLTMKWGRLRAVRWAGASIVFQGAMHSLNAVHRVGDQIAEPILLHSRSTPAAARKRAASCWSRWGCPPPAPRPTRTSCPADSGSA